MYLTFFGPGLVGCACERLLVKLYAPRLHEPSPSSHGLPKLYGGVILVNVVYSAMVLLGLGFRVGRARSQMIEEAKKEGDDPDAEDRYSLPKMQAEGFSDRARRFNCIQRGHHNALETYGSFVALSLVGGIAQPVVTAMSGLLWAKARGKWADGYASGDPKGRYDKSGGWGRHVWTALGNLMVASASTALIVCGAPI